MQIEHGLDTARIPTNQLLYSEQFDNAAWIRAGTASVSANAGIAPDGALTADLISGINSGANYMYAVAPATLTASLACSASFYIKRVSTSGTLRVENSNGSTLGYYIINLALLDDEWNRITPSHAAVTTVDPWVANAGGNIGMYFYATAGGPLSFYLWGAQIEAGVADSPGEYVATTSAAVTGVLGKNIDVPVGETWTLDWLFCHFTADAVVGNRLLTLATYDAAGNLLGNWVAGAVQAASASYKYLFSGGVWRETTFVDNCIPVAIPDGAVVIPSGGYIRLYDASAISAAADDMDISYQVAINHTRPDMPDLEYYT